MQMQIYGGEYKGSMDALKKIYKSHGLAGVYRGFGITVIREVIPTGFYYLNYEVVKRKLKTKGQVNFWEIFPAGAAAGLSYWLLSYPLDLIKTKVQHDSLEQPEYKGARGVVRAWREIRQQGWRSHLPGFNVCMIRAIPVYGLNFYIY
jgi:solute carrier family 25 carnitine/acylcarnitine transporter 20/29